MLAFGHPKNATHALPADHPVTAVICIGAGHRLNTLSGYPVNLKKLVIAALVGTVFTNGAQAASIDFEDYAPGTVLPASLTVGDATFSASSGLFVSSTGAGSSLCALAGTGCGSSLDFSFAHGAHDLKFNFLGDLDPS